jgi:riboflavin synthase
MFTGLVTDLGHVRDVHRPPAGAAEDARFIIDSDFDPAMLAVGASVACSGACLTVVAIVDGGFAVDVSGETLGRTTLGTWEPGTRVNLERSLRMGDELGGHIVTGHVDAVATVAERTADGGSWRFAIDVPDHLARYIAAKGSVALDGVSLTVNTVSGSRFGVNIIPHTFDVTTFGHRQVGEGMNLEIDILARYVARQTEAAWASSAT